MSKGPGRSAGFGAPADSRLPHFRVILPSRRNDPVEIVEYRGPEEAAKEGGLRVIRARLSRERWRAIADTVRREFNARLRVTRQPAGKWTGEEVPLDRQLGRELCVLAWAIEQASPDRVAVITRQWTLLRPEERWWLFIKTAACAGRAEDTHRGWRQALYHALSDGEPPAPRASQGVAGDDHDPPDLLAWMLTRSTE
ncbi:MAG TPA: DUF3780 domain-containing protein [Candidatus Hydrogenedentes bacterium]|nr:DUF3780 domain-containing protein [Candidatus Hydrogenedentota bacterium]